MLRLLYALLLLAWPAEEVAVERVVDGDTLDTPLGRVRVLGINSPERGERCYAEAKDEMGRLAGNSVELERDIEGRDKYDRLLRHIDGGRVQLAMVGGGYAKAYCLFPNYRYCKELEAAQAEAMNAGRGCLWAPSNNSCLRLARVNRAGSWATVKNGCDWPVDTGGAYVESDGRQREYLGETMCAGCEMTRSLEVGKYVMLSDSWGFIDFQAS